MATIENDKGALLEALLLAAPPGEVNDVFQDLRAILGPENESLVADVAPAAFSAYNTATYTTVTLPNTDVSLLLSPFNVLTNGRILDPRSNQTFLFDHVQQNVSDVQAAPEPESNQEDIRSALEKAADAYSAAHYHSGVVSVFTGGRAEALDSEDQQMNSKLASSGTFHILLAASKFSTDNFWNGKWRSTWTLDLEKKTLSGAFQANVHYYEDGNVQLDCHKEVSLDLDCDVSSPAAILAATALKLILKAETEYHMLLNETYGSLSETTFKALRRALPVTRSKIDWNAIGTYKIGHDLSQLTKDQA